MSTVDNDPVLRRAIDELRRLPAVEPAAVHRVITAAAIARVTPADEPERADVGLHGRRARLMSIVGIAAAAAVVGFLARGAWKPLAPAAQHESAASYPPLPPTPGAVLTTASAPRDRSLLPIPQQFVVENHAAHRVAIVGDFNNWNPTGAPMVRSADGGLWSATIEVLPGRHVYGFMVDDSLFMLDPRAPRTRDPDLGTEGSVLMVGRP